MESELSNEELTIEIQCEITGGYTVFLIYARKYPVPLTKQTLRMAWKIIVIPSQGQASFKYPEADLIGAFRYDDNNKITAGPVVAEPGSSWIVSTEDHSTICLTEDFNSQGFQVHHNGYVIHNMETNPETSTSIGYIINAALYKEGSERPLLSKQCRLGNYVALNPATKLYMCALIPSYSAMYNEFSGFFEGSEKLSDKPLEFADEDLVLLPDSEFSPMFELDLLKYTNRSNGKVTVTVQEEEFCGRLTFIPSSGR